MRVVALALLLGACSIEIVGQKAAPDGGASSSGIEGGVTPPPPSNIDAGKDAAVSFCQSEPKHLACADFDTGTQPLTASTLAGSPAALDLAVFKSPPSSLRFDSQAAATSTYVYQPFDPAPSNIHITFDAIVADLGENEIGGIELTLPGPSATIKLVQFLWIVHAAEAPLALFVGKADGTSTIHTSPLQGGGWHHYDLELHLAMPKSKLSGSIDGMAVVTDLEIDGLGPTQRAKALAGMYYAVSNVPTYVNIDNVTVD